MKLIYSFIIFVTLVCAIFFAHTSGLLFLDESTAHYVTELKSSGSDDNVIIEISQCWLTFLLFLRVWNWQKKIQIYEQIVASIFSVGHLLMMIYIFEVGSVYQTIVYDKNIILAAWFLGFIAIILYVNGSMIYISFYITNKIDFISKRSKTLRNYPPISRKLSPLIEEIVDEIHRRIHEKSGQKVVMALQLLTFRKRRVFLYKHFTSGLEI